MQLVQIGHYKLGRLLGEGQDSAVFLARDTVLDRQAAVKILKQSDAGAYQKVLREARLACSLDHPHICRVYEVGEPESSAEEPSPPFIAMEYIEGPSLAERLEAGPLDAFTFLRLATQIAEALAHAHDHQVIHGDISATNVLVNEECEAKLVDFGCAAGYKAEGMSTAQGDVWALGHLLYEMATGKDWAAALEGHSPGELDLREIVTPSLASIIERCADTNLARCYHTAGEVLRDLQAEMDRPSGVAHPGIEPHQFPFRLQHESSLRSGIRSVPRQTRLALLALGALIALFLLILTAGNPFRSTSRPARTPRPQPAISADGKRPTSTHKGNPDVKVWVNPRAMKYHCPDSPWYGRTISGQYLTQKQAQDQGFAPAYGAECP